MYRGENDPDDKDDGEEDSEEIEDFGRTKKIFLQIQIKVLLKEDMVYGKMIMIWIIIESV